MFLLALGLGRHSLASATSLKLCAKQTLPCTHGNQPWSTSPRHRSEWFSAIWIMARSSGLVFRTKLIGRYCPGRNQDLDFVRAAERSTHFLTASDEIFSLYFLLSSVAI